MRATIQYIEQELNSLYPKTEIKAFTRLILEQVCGLSYTQQLIKRDHVLRESDRHKIRKMVVRLKAYEPIQYIIGETEFLGMKLLVTPSVLIPRPETEELVHWIAETELPSTAALLDAGTGSGCIALGIKKLIPGVKVHAIDNSEQALDIARENADLNNFTVNFFNADILNWESASWKKYSAIVSNPPYVRESEKKNMEVNVLKFEPEKALFVTDDDPLIFYRRIAEFASLFLDANGWLFFEINENLGSEMIELVKQYGFRAAEIRRDLFGKNRMLRCRK